MDLDTWANGRVNHLAPIGTGVLLAGSRAKDPAAAGLPWLGLVDGDKTFAWELELADEGTIEALVEMGDHVALLRTIVSNASIEKVDASGTLLSSEALSMPEGESALLDTMARSGETLLVGGRSQDDFLIAKVGDNGSLEPIVREDHAGFVDTVVALTPTIAGFVAVVHAPTTPKWIDDVGIPQAVDILVLCFDEEGNEVHRETFTSDGDVWVGTAVPLPGGDVIVAGDQAPIIDVHELGDRSAWAARVSIDGVVWREEWSGPEDGGAQALARFVAAHPLDGNEVVLAGGQSGAAGLRRWHVIVDADDGRVIDEVVGDAAEDSSIDSYWASGPTSSASFAGTTVTSKGSAQWLCEFTEG